MTSIRLNYRSDFDFIFRLLDDGGSVIPFPGIDWTARFCTSDSSVSYVASCRDGQFTNCFCESDGSMHFVFENHGLGTGQLLCEFRFDKSNLIYSALVQKLFDKIAIAIELVDGRSDSSATVEIKAVLHTPGAESFSWDALTSNGIEVLEPTLLEPAGSKPRKLSPRLSTATKGKKFNYKSDFDIVIHLVNTEGSVVPFPGYDWYARFHTSMRNVCYVASYRNGVYTNCYRENDGSIHFVFENHGLGKGKLLCEFRYEAPNSIFPSGIQKLFDPNALDFELVDGRTDCATTAEVQAMLPYIKGEPFRYEDFTPENIKELQRPATEVVESLNEHLRAAQTAEQERLANEQARVAAENERARQFATWEDKISPNIPKEVENEAAMQALIDAGEAKDGNIYFIAEKED